MQHGRFLLFGRFEALTGSGAVPGLVGRKVQELFAYLVLQKSQPVHRERLAEQLWPDTDARRSKKYLRQSLWQLQKALEGLEVSPDSRLLNVDQEWLSINKDADLSVDVYEFERGHANVLNVPPDLAGTLLRRSLERAVELYRGDLLEGWYCPWTSYFQDQYLSMYLLILDKLMQDAEETGRWEVGLVYGRAVLKIDPANERAHVRMMRLHCIGGDRTAALRQFHFCTRALREDLGVEPEDATKRLYELVRTDGHGCVERVLPLPFGASFLQVLA